MQIGHSAKIKRVAEGGIGVGKSHTFYWIKGKNFKLILL
jgi:hypothetical protein